MTSENEIQLSDQETFDRDYICSSEIAKELGVSRVAIHNARSRGLLPSPICVNGTQLTLWNRQKVRPFIDAWKIILNVRRTVKND